MTLVFFGLARAPSHDIIGALQGVRIDLFLAKVDGKNGKNRGEDVARRQGDIDPSKSPTHAFGGVLRRWRDLCGLSVREAAGQMMITDSVLSRWEHGERLPPKDKVTLLDQLYNADGVLVALRQVVSVAEGAPGSTLEVRVPNGRDDGDDMERRTVLQLLTAMSVGAAVPVGALEIIRDGFDKSVDATGDYSLADWEAAAYQAAFDIRVKPPTDFIAGLLPDFVDIRKALEARPESDRAGLQRVGSQFAALMAMALVETGQFAEARRWWRSSRTAADASGDLDLRVWVRGRQAAIETDMPGYTAPLVLRLAQEAEHLSGGRSSVGVAEAWIGRSVVMALSPVPGEPVLSAERVLGRYDEIGAELPEFAIRETKAIWGWPSERHFGTRTNLSVLSGADDAYDQLARKLETIGVGGDQRAITATRLAQSTLLVKERPTEGLDQALQAYTALPAEHRTTTIKWWIDHLMRQTPDHARALPAVQELKALTA
ncbi:helix-turn-helix transcriptional regulator [Streptosporangium sp. NPDC020072]|uniref:helix-turn-helix domain-containing protein n=1 Tax=Streptosporangium sp. NPDC020072 TaxID=3154788 RepID=UPI00342FD704